MIQLKQEFIIIANMIIICQMQLRTIFLILTVVSLSNGSTSDSIKCHYSCESCTQPYHQFCKTCAQGYDLLVLKNPSQIPLDFRDTRSITGVCTKQNLPSYPNGLGLFLLISAFISISVSKSNLVFTIISSMQSLSLIRFLQINWINPANYVLNAFQYLSPCNILTQQIKQNSWKMKLYSFFYLNDSFIQPQLQKSLILIGSLNIAVFLLILFLHILRIIKRKYYGDKCRNILIISQWGIKKQITFLSCVFYFLIQQTILSFVISLQFIQPISGFMIGTISVYTIMSIIFLIYIYGNKIDLFENRLIQYYCIIKKIIYPIFVVVPFEYQYILLILMGVNCIMQGIFYYKIKVYGFRSLQAGYKFIQFMTILLGGVYYLVDSTAIHGQIVLVISIIFTLALIANIIMLAIETVYKIYNNYQQIKKQQQKILEKQQKSQIPQRSVLDRDNTFPINSTKRQDRKQSTQTDLMENTQHIHHILQQSIEEPPKFQRTNTKDSSFYNSSDKERKDIKIQNIQQKPQQQPQQKDKEKEKEKEEQDGIEIIKIQKKKIKNNQNMKTELRKRYGV